MATVKTAISLSQPLAKRVDAWARRMKVPRSRLCAMALEDFLRRQENKELVRRINEAYSDAPDQEEKDWLDAALLLHGEVLAKEKW